MCDHLNCIKVSTHTVCLQVKVAGKPIKEGPLIAIMKVCSEHNDVKWADLIEETVWQACCKIVLDAGYAAPSRAHSRVVAVPIQDATSDAH